MIYRYTASLLIAAPTMFFLGGRFGIVGIATAILLESVLIVILTLSAFPSVLKMPVPQLWAPKEDLAYIFGIWSEWRAR